MITLHTLSESGASALLTWGNSTRDAAVRNAARNGDAMCERREPAEPRRAREHAPSHLPLAPALIAPPAPSWRAAAASAWGVVTWTFPAPQGG